MRVLHTFQRESVSAVCTEYNRSISIHWNTVSFMEIWYLFDELLHCLTLNLPSHPVHSVESKLGWNACQQSALFFSTDESDPNMLSTFIRAVTYWWLWHSGWYSTIFPAWTITSTHIFINPLLLELMLPTLFHPYLNWILPIFFSPHPGWSP